MTGANRAFLISIGVRNACSEGRFQIGLLPSRTRRRLSENKRRWTLSSSMQFVSVFDCAANYTRLICRCQGFFGRLRKRANTRFASTLLPCYFLFSIFAAGTVNVVLSTAEFIIFLPIWELTTAVVTWEMNAVKTSKSG